MLPFPTVTSAILSDGNQAFAELADVQYLHPPTACAAARCKVAASKPALPEFREVYLDTDDSRHHSSLCHTTIHSHGLYFQGKVAWGTALRESDNALPYHN